MLRAAALMNAILISVLVAIFCGVIILIGFYNRYSIQRNLNLNDLIDTHSVCVEYFKSTNYNNSNLSLNEKNCRIKKEKWGLLEVALINSEKNNDSISKCFLSTNTLKNAPLLYLSDHKELLKISGDSNLSGDLVIPQGKLDRTNIQGNNSRNSFSTKGDFFSSGSQLPQIVSFASLKRNAKGILISIEELINKKITQNEFIKKPTYIISIDGDISLEDISLKGNFKIVTNGTIVLNKTAQLEDVIIVADQIVVDRGFTGAVQLFAKEIIMEENVYFKFPSIIFSELDSNDEIYDMKFPRNARLEGALILKSTNQRKTFLTLEEKSSVKGIIYCNGYLSNNGKVKGSVFSDWLKVKTTYSEYTNLILNQKLDTLSYKQRSMGFSIKYGQDEGNQIILKEL